MISVLKRPFLSLISYENSLAYVVLAAASRGFRTVLARECCDKLGGGMSGEGIVRRKVRVTVISARTVSSRDQTQSLNEVTYDRPRHDGHPPGTAKGSN